MEAITQTYISNLSGARVCAYRLCRGRWGVGGGTVGDVEGGRGRKGVGK